ncbi:MAG: hypothetical protein N2651_07110 [Fimbriimonadales bacterium]|nr:hypothetical protein [Fimbriimonadales bacterium]
MRYRKALYWARGLLLCGVVGLGLGEAGFANRSTAKQKPQAPSVAAKASAPTSRKQISGVQAASKPTNSKSESVPRASNLSQPATFKPITYGTSRSDWLTPNWFLSESIEAVGVAPYPVNAPSRAQARIQARRAAILDAQRQLVEQLYGVSITSSSWMSERGLQEDTNARAQGVIQGAQVVSERDWGDSYEVTLRWYPPKQSPSESTAPTPEPLDSPRFVIPPPASLQGYTGVVIDARGSGLQPSMSPRIRDTAGNIVWGHLEIDPQTVIEYGIAGWARTQSDLDHSALRARIGGNPLTLKAIGAQGAGRNEVILSHSDAERLLRENARSGFLERLAVVVLY